MKPIEQLLREKIGLDARSVGSSAIERSVRLRMKSLGLKKSEDYQRLLESGPGRDEWEELVESVVVTETWFFRDRDPFAALIQLLRLEWLPQHPAGPARLLSVACASGEEPYSLAMALLDADIPPDRFTMDAVDLSARALAKAQRAVYGKNSFRGKDLDFRERHFQATQDGHALQPRVRDCVRFHRANLFEEDFLAGHPVYDFIFCRNLLIYLDSAAQAKALEKLDRLLAPQGRLFVGPAELPLATAHGFVSANIPMAFACRRVGGGGKLLRAPRGRPDEVSRPAKPDSAIPGSLSTGKQIQRVTSTPAAPQAVLDLAAAGQLAAAAAICQAHLDRQGPSAQAYYLLGLVHDAGGDPQAMDCYRKALYLEPTHYDSLLHMSLLLERSGDVAGARRFKRRADRVEAKSRRAPRLSRATTEGPAAPAAAYAAERVQQKP